MLLDWKGVLILVGAAGAGLYLARRQVSPIVAAINPFNNDNVIYRAYNAPYALITRDPDFSIGARLFDWLPSAARRRERASLEGLGP